MKILVVANFDVGLYKFRKELLQEMINRGHDVYISLPNGDLVEPLTELGCNFIDTSVAFCIFFICRNVSDNRKQSSYAVYGRE